MRRTLLIALILVAACATSDYDDRRPRERPRAGDDDLLPASDWWRSPHIAEAVNLTSEQIAQLDKLQSEQGDEIQRLTRDLMVATRDIRTAANQKQATANDIVAAGDRVAALRDQLFRRRIAMLAAERAILSYEQWTALQEQAEERRERWSDEGRRGRMGGRGRGGRGGMGRRPPF